MTQEKITENIVQSCLTFMLMYQREEKKDVIPAEVIQAYQVGITSGLILCGYDEKIVGEALNDAGIQLEKMVPRENTI